MTFLELAKSRYSTKKYDGSKEIPQEKLDALKEIIRLSPSSINSQPWKFAFVTNPDLKNQFSEISYHNKEKVQNAGLLVVFLGLDDVSVFENKMTEYIPQGSIDYYFTHVKPKDEAEIKAWIQHQVYLSLGFFLSGVASLELDSTPMEGIEGEKYDEILQLKNYKTLFAVAVGHRDTDDFNQPNRKPKSRLEETKTIVEFK